MRWADLKINRVEVSVTLVLVAIILLGTGNLDSAWNDKPAAPAVAESAGAGSMQSYWRATMLELRAGWEGVFGQTQGSGYQLFAAMGHPDVETLENYHAANGIGEVRRVFSQR